MAEVVKQSVVQSGQDSFTGIFMWFGQNWGLLVTAIIVLILAIVIFILLKNWEDERKERDDPVYEGYKNLIRDTITHADPKRIRKSWSAINILWLGIPFVKKEHSARIVDYADKFLAYYRGHSWSQDGYYNILCYQTKFLIFFEDIFLIRCPLQLDTVIKLKGKDGKLKRDNDGKIMVTKKSFDYSAWIGELKNGDIKIRCTGLQKLSYFRYPVYLDHDAQIIDLRREVKEDIVDLSGDQMLARILTTGHQMVEKAMLHNPNVQYEQKIPEKTKTEQSEDGGG